jgi:hypothetical protein
MATPDRIRSDTSWGQAVIAIRARDVAHMAWIMAEVESEHALRAWFDTDAPQDAYAYRVYRAAVDREEAAARDLQRLSQLTQPAHQRLAQGA